MSEDPGPVIVHGMGTHGDDVLRDLVLRGLAWERPLPRSLASVLEALQDDREDRIPQRNEDEGTP